MELTAKNVEMLMSICLFDADEPLYPRIQVEGIVNNYAFHPARIEDHNEEIHQLLLELPAEFQQSTGGGGWSFLNMCMDKHGNQWTGLHWTQEQLMALGIASGWVADVAKTKGIWPILPGGMPYVTVFDERSPMEVIEGDPISDTES